MNKLAFLFLSLMGLCCGALFAQTSVNIGSQSSVTGCNINIYDDGGIAGNYGPSHDYTLTIYPDANQGRVALEIVNLDIHNSDTLFVYDGTSTSASLLCALNNGSIGAQLFNNHFMATPDNPNGALTLRFKTSYFVPQFDNNHGTGFELHSSCAPSCMSFQIAFDTANCSHLPVLNPADQYFYLDLCPGETVQLATKGIYPSGTAGGYWQSDVTTHFSWILDNNTVQSGIGLTSITHTFPPGIGCEVSVIATDTLSCPALQPVTFRVRTSDNPIHSVHNIPQLCTGQSFTPTVGTTNSNNIVLDQVGYVQTTSLAVNDTVFLPDGENCPPYGLYYRSNVTFTEFPPGSTLTSANDILYVRVKMEHSAIEDLKIQIFCPNGSSSTILPHPNFEADWVNGMWRVNLGTAYRPDGGTCDASINPMGEPWNYVWSNNNTLGYQYASSNGCFFNPTNFHTHYNPHWDDGTTTYSVDSTNVAAMTQVYHPFQSFNSLVGCPLNGNWYIQVQDLYQEDNGYIVEWELALNPQLMPSIWCYDVAVDTFYFTGNGANGGTLQPDSPGIQSYSMTITDNFGCQYDTTFAVTVYQQPIVDLGDDRYICPGGVVTLAPSNTGSSYSYHWSTGATQQHINAIQPGTYTLTVNVMNGFSVLCQSSDSVEVFLLENSDTILTDIICAGETYNANGFNISASTLQNLDAYSETRTLVNYTGCDSVVTLFLTILPRYNHTIQKYACEQYTWDGDTYTESGDYTKSYTSVNGCDSTVTLHLSIGHPAEEEVWETVCERLIWNGEIFTETGDYIRHFASMHECDSMVLMHLTVLDTFLHTSVSNPDFCTTRETELSVEGNFDDYVWSTGEVGSAIYVTTSGLYTLTASNIACQQVERFNVPYCPLDLLLPNAITPSKNDGYNDVLSLSEFEKNQIDAFDITIFNRWGELIFWSEDKNFVWDGRKDGKLMINVVYNYVIHCTDHRGKPYLFKGSVTVL